MRRFDKKKNIEKANLLAEQRYLESKGLIKESFYDINGAPIGVNHKHEPVTEGLLSEENFTDLFNFLEQDPRKMGGASVMYVNLVAMNKNYINPETGEKEPNPMWGKIYKHTRFMFRWEDTYGRAVERENPEHEMGQRSGTYEKIDGYDMLEQGKSGLYLPIIPTGSESTYSISEDGKSHEPISYEEIKPYMKEYKPSTGGSGVKFRPLIVDRIAKIKAGGNEWNNPNFVFGNYIGPNS